MEGKRISLNAGLIIAAIGVIVLGSDRIIASANSKISYVKTLNFATVIGVALILVAIIIFYRAKNSEER